MRNDGSSSLKGAGAMMLATAAAVMLALLLVQDLAAQPLSGQARARFDRVVHRLDPADFGTLQLLAADGLQAVYDANRARTAELRGDAKRRTWRQPWETLRDSYLSVAMSAPAAALAAQSVFRAAECQEELAGWSRSGRDWRRAVALYESVARRHSGSVRCDDALYSAARICAAQLRRPDQARAYIDWLLESFPGGDMAPKARTLRQTLDSGVAVAYASPAARDAAVKRAEPAAGAKAAKQTKATAGAKAARQAKAAAGAKAAKQTKATAGAKAARQAKAVKRTCLRPDGKPWLITIDAGHGGRDPGTLHNGVVERDITLDVALRLGRLLKKAGLRVHYTRTTDRYITLANRTAAANSRGSDLFVSIHVNAHSNPAIRGCEIYYLDSSPSSSTAVARRENASSGRITRTDSRQSTLTSRLLMSRRLAGAVNTSLLGTVRDSGYDMESMGVRRGPFYVLATAAMPSVLAEIGYCTNKTEAALLRLGDYRQTVAEGLAAGIVRWCSSAATVVAENASGRRLR